MEKRSLDNKSEVELRQLIGEVLHYLWDPIGVKDEPHARDEYADYVSQIFDLVVKRYPTDEIAERLSSIMETYMGITITEDIRDENLRLAGIMLTYRSLYD
jgi:hypothetical protein